MFIVGVDLFGFYFSMELIRFIDGVGLFGFYFSRAMEHASPVEHSFISRRCIP